MPQEEVCKKEPKTLRWYLGAVICVLVLAWVVILGDYIAYVYDLTH